MPKLTKRVVESATPEATPMVLNDTEIKGFQCKISPLGKRTYLLYYRTQEGRERRPAIGEHGKITCEQARDIAKDWLARVHQGEDVSKSRQEARKTLTLAEFVEIYAKRHVAGMKPSSQKEDARMWSKYILPVLGSTRLNVLTRRDVDRLHQRMRDTPYMANRVLELLRRAFNLAAEWGYMDGENPCRHVKKFKEQSRERFLSAEEMARLGEAFRQCGAEQLESPQVLLALQLLIYTGCRRNEILELRWDWIDFTHKRINFPDSKTGKKTLDLNDAVIELLHKVERVVGNPFVIVGKNGQKHLVNLRKPWQRIMKRAGLENIRLHDLRHSFASVGAASGLSLPMIGKLLSHKQATTTQRYAHLTGEVVREASNIVGNSITAALEGKQADVISLRKG